MLGPINHGGDNFGHPVSAFCLSEDEDSVDDFGHAFWVTGEAYMHASERDDVTLITLRITTPMASLQKWGLGTRELIQLIKLRVPTIFLFKGVNGRNGLQQGCGERGGCQDI